MPLQLQMRRVEDVSSEPPALSTLLWDVVMTDLCARAMLQLLKTLIAVVAPASAARRLRRVFAAVEAFGFLYRLMLPTPLWFHWLFHAAEGATFAHETVQQGPSLYVLARLPPALHFASTTRALCARVTAHRGPRKPRVHMQSSTTCVACFACFLCFTCFACFATAPPVFRDGGARRRT